MATRPKGPWFEIAKSGTAYTWCLWSANGRPLAISAVTYGSVNDTKQAIRTFVNIAKGGESLPMMAQTEFLAPPQPAKSAKPIAPSDDTPLPGKP